MCPVCRFDIFFVFYIYIFLLHLLYTCFNGIMSHANARPCLIKSDVHFFTDWWTLPKSLASASSCTLNPSRDSYINAKISSRTINHTQQFIVSIFFKTLKFVSRNCSWNVGQPCAGRLGRITRSHEVPNAHEVNCGDRC